MRYMNNVVDVNLEKYDKLSLIYQNYICFTIISYMTELWYFVIICNSHKLVYIF